MQANLKAVIELLKQEVLTRAGRLSVDQACFPVLAMQIQETTGRQLSIFTLSRFYEFTESKFGPSLFTLDVLSLYCGYQSWQAFAGSKTQIQE